MRWIFVLALLCVACTAKHLAAPPAETATARADEAPGPIPPPLDAPPRTPESAEALAIGWAAIADPTDAEIHRLWRRARSAERKGRPSLALESYATALQRAPSRTDIRMAYAERLAAQGHLDAAMQQLAQVLREDLPQHRNEALMSETLAPIRARSGWDSTLSAIEGAYADTLTRGVPAFTYVRRDGWVNGEFGGTPQTPYTHVRVGLYDPQTHRFVPIAPAVPRTFTGFVDRERKRALVVRGDLKRKNMWTVKPDRNRAIVYSLESWGSVVFEARGVARDTQWHEWDAFGVWLGADDSSLWVVREETYHANGDTLLWTASGKQLVARTRWHGEDELDAPPEFPDRAPDVWVGEEASARVPSTEGAARIEARLRDDGSLIPAKDSAAIELEPGHDDNSFVVASPIDPSKVVVFRTMDPPDPTLSGGEDGATRPERQDVHTIDVVDLEREKVSRIGHGAGTAFMAWAPDGSVFFETPNVLVRCSPPDYEPVRDIPEGVHFGTPHFPEEGGV